MTSSVLDGTHVVPTIQHLPPDVHSLAAAEEAIEWGECYGLTLDADQQATLRAALGERKDGSWAASLVCDFKGRQAGKNDTVKVRQGAGIDLFHERLQIHTAHEFATANEDFLRLVAMYESYDDLRKTVERIRYGNGERGIEFLNGARIMYRARTGGAGRGFSKADIVFYDEAQHVRSAHLGASFPTMLVAPNFQAWFCGSGGFETSTEAWRYRRDAILGAGGRFAYTENTAQIIRVDGSRITLESPPDLLDEDVLMTHPAYANGRVSRDVMETMYQAMGPAEFGREILNLWEAQPVEDEPFVPNWADLVDSGSQIAADWQFALDVSPDRRWSTVGVAGRRSDGLLHVEAFDNRPGNGWVVDVCAKVHDRWRLPIRVQQGSPAAALVDPLREVGVQVLEVTAADHAKGLGQLLDAATNGRLRHLGALSLNRAIHGAVVRPSGDVDILARRSSKADITPLVAVVLALSGVPVAKVRRPRVHTLREVTV